MPKPILPTSTGVGQSPADVAAAIATHNVGAAAHAAEFALLNGTYVALTGDQTVAGVKQFRDGIKSRTVAGDTGSGAIVMKGVGDLAAGVIDWLHDSDFGYLFHLTTGIHAIKPWACIGIGVDNDGVGLHVGNKLKGYGIELINYNTITAADAYGLIGSQYSTVAPLVFLAQYGAAVQPALRLFVNDAPGVNQVLARFGGYDGDYGFIYADGGRLEWSRPVTVNNAQVTVNGASGVYAGYATNSFQTLLSFLKVGDTFPKFTIKEHGAFDWGAGSVASDVNLYRSTNGRIATDKQFQAVDGVATKVNAGIVADASFLRGPADGTIAVDSTNNRFAARIGGAWKAVDLGISADARLRATAVKAETIPRNGQCQSDIAALATGRQSFQLIWIDAGTVVSNISFAAWVTGAGTPTNQWFSLYSLALAKLAVTVDDTTTAWAAFTRKTLAVSSPYTVTTSGLYYVGCMVKATTVPTLVGSTGLFNTMADSPMMLGFDNTNTGLTTPATAPATAAALTVSGTAGVPLVQIT